MKLSAVFAGVRRVFETVGTSAGAADAGKIGHLNAVGMCDVTQCMTFTGAGAPVNYTDGDPVATGEGTAPKGCAYIDTTNANWYINTGTLAQPTWKLVTRAA